MVKSDNRNGNMDHPVVIRIQSVIVVPLRPSTDGSRTIGQHVDCLIESEREAGRLPNKLAVDLYPADDMDGRAL